MDGNHVIACSTSTLLYTWDYKSMRYLLLLCNSYRLNESYLAHGDFNLYSVGISWSQITWVLETIDTSLYNYPLQGLICCAFCDAFLLARVVKSDYLSHRCPPVSSKQSGHSPPSSELLFTVCFWHSSVKTVEFCGVWKYQLTSFWNSNSPPMVDVNKITFPLHSDAQCEH